MPEVASSTHRWPHQWSPDWSVTTPQPNAVSAHQRHVRVSDTPGPEDGPKLCSQWGSGQVRAVRWPEVGRDEFWCDLAKIFNGSIWLSWQWLHLVFRCINSLMVNYKIFSYDQLSQILFIIIVFCESYAAQCACHIFETQCRSVRVGSQVFVCIGYDLCHLVNTTQTDRQACRQTDSNWSDYMHISTSWTKMKLTYFLLLL